MENYICINGKKAELTEEQLKALGIELPKKSPFERVEKGEKYYCIEALGNVCSYTEDYYGIDTQAYDIANYCTDKSIMEQRALHETLNRLLWRYSMEHDGDKINWDNYVCNYRIARHRSNGKFFVDFNDGSQDVCAVYFYTKEIALNAIEEIVKPFMKAHPEFKF